MTPQIIRPTVQQLRRWAQDSDPTATRPTPFLKRTPPPAVGEGWAKQAAQGGETR